jgi:hypothetical protein
MVLGTLALPGPLEGRWSPRSELPLRDSTPPAPPAPPPALPVPQLLQGIVRAGRGASDPLTDVRIL